MEPVQIQAHLRLCLGSSLRSLNTRRVEKAGKNLFSKGLGDGVLSLVITKIFRGTLATLSVACLTTGCQSPRSESNPKVVMETSTRNNCYSLLHQLLSEEKDVSLLRFIKHEPDDVKRLINRIAAT